MTFYALWHGGPNYTPSSVPEHVERFASIAAAKRALLEREQDGRLCVFDYVNRPMCVTDTPNVQDSEIHLFLGKPDERDPYPDRILTIGPRGGVQSRPA